ncbi:hypothetical protein Tco_1224661 [Tanacetum coccineum]
MFDSYVDPGLIKELIFDKPAAIEGPTNSETQIPATLKNGELGGLVLQALKESNRATGRKRRNGGLGEFKTRFLMVHISSSLQLRPTVLQFIVNMDDPNITMKEYVRLEEEKARRHGKVYNWETATYGKIWDNEDVYGFGSVESEFSTIVFNDTLTSEAALSCEPMVSSLNNDEINFTISFDESDDEDCTLFFDDLDYFKDFDKEFPAIVYNDALTSKLYFLTKPTVSPQHIDEFNLKDKTSLSECDEEEQNILYFNDVFPFNVIYPDDSISDKDNDDDKIDIKQSSGGINTAYPGERKSTNVGKEFTNLEILKCWSLETSRRLFNTNSSSINLHGESTEQISGEFLILILFNYRI